MKDLRCLFGSHDLRSIAKIGFAGEHYGCIRCKRQWGMNHDVRAVLPWSDVSGAYAHVFGYDPSPEVVADRLNPANWRKRLD